MTWVDAIFSAWLDIVVAIVIVSGLWIAKDRRPMRRHLRSVGKHNDDQPRQH